MAKSADLTACVPSLPLIPTPMWASMIIETSLAPSPIARVIQEPRDLKMVTTSAFCLGDILQHTTDLDLMAMWKNRSYNSWSSIISASVLPSTAITWLNRSTSFSDGIFSFRSTSLFFACLNILLYTSSLFYFHSISTYILSCII